MIACTIAGSDSGGGAGIQADVKTFQELGVFGTTAITALTAQNTLGVHGIHAVEPAFVVAQLDAILADFHVKAVKTGMLFSSDIIEAVANRLADEKLPLVIDPVMIAKGGQSLLQQQAIDALKTHLLPLATVCTPNIPEAEALTGVTICDEGTMQQAAEQLLACGVKYVVIKGGHAVGNTARDAIFTQTDAPFYVETTRANTKHTHGTGCTFSAAVTACIAKGLSVRDAIIEAKRFVDAAIKHPLGIGQGFGPTNHFAYNQKLSAEDVYVL